MKNGTNTNKQKAPVSMKRMPGKEGKVVNDANKKFIGKKGLKSFVSKYHSSRGNA